MCSPFGSLLSSYSHVRLFTWQAVAELICQGHPLDDNYQAMWWCFSGVYFTMMVVQAAKVGSGHVCVRTVGETMETMLFLESAWVQPIFYVKSSSCWTVRFLTLRHRVTRRWSMPETQMIVQFWWQLGSAKFWTHPDFRILSIFSSGFKHPYLRVKQAMDPPICFPIKTQFVYDFPLPYLIARAYSWRFRLDILVPTGSGAK